ncbi:hypothetical protein Pma05_71950 [Plantactinospora mayteni]|uniref:Uncharacterized protein n=1 Tax=Plantactinospora mayteni TaxID=566021 RepID=A0ABQ4F120_9ACTN|nr:hypothetical protein Pma05_71950 [Plantactinospora mayteni]
MISAAVAFMAFGGIWGTQIFGALTTEGFDDPAFRRAVTETLDALPSSVVTRTVTSRAPAARHWSAMTGAAHTPC